MSTHRSDALRNRETILRVADEAFAEGVDVVPLEEIARRARLGRATVYRHFPDRRALGLAVAAQQLRALCRMVKHQEAAPRPFRELLAMVLAMQVSRRPLVRLFRELPVRYQQQKTNALITILTPAFRRAQVDGQLRADVQPTVLLLVFEMVEAAITAGSAAVHQDDAVRRVVNVVLDGFFAVAPAR
ncbi:TetR/AcrR family transcriptional regulator [Amycolatopsis methanolica]|uniref:TetR family transcriptional regulator n=1 Tax=Amycolatopsis methanolica 239 TaxID=1068978 RepID=A0A076MW83_AMYME|nr:TetR/AcrR family transcriptional regulator [Amycolatopsis methanolica]AIJ22002.1 TetR family transcriptional regulator [Amycolatopsis methanolica 239]